MKADNEDVLMNMLSSDNLRCIYIYHTYTMLINNSIIELGKTEETSW